MSRKYDLEKILGQIKRRKISVSQYAKENGLSYHNLSSAIYYAKSHQQIDTESLCITSISNDPRENESYNFSVLFGDNTKIKIEVPSIKDLEAILRAAKNV